MSASTSIEEPTGVVASYACTVEPMSASTSIVASYACTETPISASTTIVESYACTETPIDWEVNGNSLKSSAGFGKIIKLVSSVSASFSSFWPPSPPPASNNR